MFTLTAQDLHGVIVLDEGQTEEDIIAGISEETGLLNPDKCRNPQILPVTVAVNQCGRNVLKLTDVSPCLNARDYKGYAGKKDMIAVIEEQKG